MRLKTWVAAGIAAVLVAIVVAVSVVNWHVVGDTGMLDTNGWIALLLGALLTLLVGIGLMALIFISNRRGYDNPPRRTN